LKFALMPFFLTEGSSAASIIKREPGQMPENLHGRLQTVQKSSYQARKTLV
jgi:hypothetical protein